MQGTHEVSAAEVQRVFPHVAATIADALGRDAEEVQLDRGLIEDLGAESIDFLDIVFRLERQFQVRIPRGKIVDDVRGDLGDADFEVRGVVTEAGLARLRAYLSEVPGERFRPRLRVNEIPLLFTVETFCKVVVRAQHQSPAGGRGA
jgi:acyl carrier protein